MRNLPPSMASVSFCLSSGAVKRSISPRTATTWRSSSSASSVSENSGGMWRVILSGECVGRRRRGQSRGSAAEAESDGDALCRVGAVHLDLVGDPLEDVADAGQRGVGEQTVGAPLTQFFHGHLDALGAGRQADGDVPVDGVGL